VLPMFPEPMIPISIGTFTSLALSITLHVTFLRNYAKTPYSISDSIFYLRVSVGVVRKQHYGKNVCGATTSKVVYSNGASFALPLGKGRSDESERC
jgi:hypothetical protein